MQKRYGASCEDELTFIEQGDDGAKVRLQFPVGLIHHLPKKGNYAAYAQCVSAGTPGQCYLQVTCFLFNIFFF